MKAYHCLKSDMCSGEGPQRPWKVGERRSVRGPLVLCEHGYHWSPTPWDALHYGPVLCLVEVPDGDQHDGTKGVSRWRRLLVAQDVSRELRLLAARYAEDVAPLWVAPRGVSWTPADTISVARRYALGQATEEELAAAWNAARDAARAKYRQWANETLTPLVEV